MAQNLFPLLYAFDVCVMFLGSDGYCETINRLFFSFPGKTYFFRGDDFWRFDDVMVKAEENFPLSIKDYWLGC